MFKDFIKKLFSLSSKPYMEKEIYEQEKVIKTVLKKYVKSDGTINIDLPEGIKKVVLTASGSSYHSAAAAAYFIRAYTELNAQACYSSEVALVKHTNVFDDTLYVFISQSGETTDTNKALKKAAEKTNKTLAVTNTLNSSLYNTAKYKLLTFAGKENAIASTKAVSAQTLVLFLIAVKLMQSSDKASVSDIISELKQIPQIIKNTLSERRSVFDYAKKLSKYHNANVLGSGIFYPLAKETALKIKETSYINTTAYPAGEFLHGHVAILNKKCALINLINVSNADFFSDVMKKIDKNYETETLIITNSGTKDFKEKDIININTKSDITFFFASLILIQLLALETAIILKRDADRPAGLSKVLK